MIKEKNGKYCVYDSSGNKILGCHSTNEDAKKQLDAIEISKQDLRAPIRKRSRK